MTWLRLLLVAIVPAGSVGCGANSPNDSSNAKVLTMDEKVLLALDCYDPMYEMDANARVIRLRLTGRHLPAPVLVEIGKLKELHGIDLYGTTLTDEGLAHLKNLQQLKSIGLGATLITDKGLEHLEKLQSLQYVWLTKGRVTPEGVEKLKTARPDMNVYDK